MCRNWQAQGAAKKNGSLLKVGNDSSAKEEEMNKQERRAWFLERVGLMLTDLSNQGFKFMCYEFYRTPEEQALDYAKGASQIRKGLHQVWQAMDLAHLINGKISWADGPAYIALDRTAKKYGLSTGRNWKTLKDLNHVESVLGWVDLGLIKG